MVFPDLAGPAKMIASNNLLRTKSIGSRMYGATSGFQFPDAPLGFTIRKFVAADSETETRRAGRIISDTPSLISLADAYTLCDQSNFFVFHDSVKKDLSLLVNACVHRVNLLRCQCGISL